MSTRSLHPLQAFADISNSLKADCFLQPHFRYYIREVRVVAYSQVSCVQICILQHAVRPRPCNGFTAPYMLILTFAAVPGVLQVSDPAVNVGRIWGLFRLLGRGTGRVYCCRPLARQNRQSGRRDRNQQVGWVLGNFYFCWLLQIVPLIDADWERTCNAGRTQRMPSTNKRSSREICC